MSEATWCPKRRPQRLGVRSGVVSEAAWQRERGKGEGRGEDVVCCPKRSGVRSGVRGGVVSEAVWGPKRRGVRSGVVSEAAWGRERGEREG